MIYISTFAYIKSFIRTQGEGLGAFVARSFIGRFSMFWIGLVFVLNVWERNLFSEYLQYRGILVYTICLISISNSVFDGVTNKSVLNIERS